MGSQVTETGPFVLTNKHNIGKADSPIHLNALDTVLENYPNQETAEFLGNGFRFGFRIPFEGPRVGRFSKNHPSAVKSPDIINCKLAEEVRLGRIAGPFNSPPFEDLIISPLGLVPKSTPGEWRMIFDLSFPKGKSVNAGIPPDEATVQYTKFDEITRIIREEGPGCSLIKVDIKSAFRLIPINPDDFDLLGMCFEGNYYVDKCLPFGLSVSCAIFEKFSCFLEWAIKDHAATKQIIHYLDDFCAGDKNSKRAGEILSKILQFFAYLGVPVAKEKIEGPATNLKFLGLEIDTVQMLVKIPQDKLIDLNQVIDDTIGKYRHKITLKDLQSLIGKLSFACRAVVPGRAFLRRLIDATIGVKLPHHHIRVTNAMLQDLLVWQQFLKEFNGSSMITQSWSHATYFNLYTDAAGTEGFGAFLDNQWTNGKWPRDFKSGRMLKDITFKELFPIVLAIYLWGDNFVNQKVLFHCDNQAVVTIINRQTSKSKRTMHLVRLLVSYCLGRNIAFRAVHIPGAKNGIADALSRFQFRKFRRLAPHAQKKKTPIPVNLLNKLRPR